MADRPAGPRRAVPSILWAAVLLGAGLAVLPLGGAAAASAPSAHGSPFHGASASPLIACPAPFLVNISAVPPTGTVPLTVRFAAILSGGCAPYSVEWEFGDGAEGNGTNASHTYESAGAFTVDAEATDANGTIAETTAPVTVSGGSGGLSVSVHALVPQGPAPLNDTFWANVTGGTPNQTLSTVWSFGEDANGTGSPIHYTFLEAGNYTVVGTVTSSTSGAVSASVLVHVGPATAPPPPTLQLSATPSTAYAPANVSAMVLANGSGGPFGFSLCFGDGSPCVNFGPYPAGLKVYSRHTYNATGNYTIDATLLAGGVAVARASTGVSLRAGPRLAVSASADLSGGSAPLPVTFLAVVSGGTPPYTLQWAFGDGTVGGSLPNATVGHTYASAGAYAPSVTVRDSAGHSVRSLAASIDVRASAPSAPGGLGSIAGLPVVILLAVLVLAAVGVGVLVGRRSMDRAVERRLRQEGEELVREMERPP